jgi:threonine aldolase
MPEVYDLRSDTVTRPGPAMRQAMAHAEVGDDCWGDDPTVHALQERVAALLGKPAAVFLPSGTMANQVAVHLHCRPGDAIATHPGAHVRIHEDASAARLSGAQIMPIGQRNGYTVEQLSALCQEESCGWPRVALVWLENTIGDAGGALWPLREPTDGPNDADPQVAIATWAQAAGRPVHLDGARLWNAHAATGLSLAALAAPGTTVSVALSKGLGAPMGSLLCGDEDLARRARAVRHAFGGGMRQAGLMAAAGLFALEHNLPRLEDDHRRARRLAEGIADLEAWDIDPPQTNMVIARVRPPVVSAESLCGPLRAAGILCHPNVYREVRLAVHLGLDDEAIETIVTRVRHTVREVWARLAP